MRLVPALLASLLLVSAPAGEPDAYRITDAVLIKDPPRFGVNVNPPSQAPWNIDRMVNEWSFLSACEPLSYQYSGVCDGGATDFLQHRDGPRLSWWGSAESGYWDGAEVRIYRLGDDGLRLLRTATVASSICGNAADGSKSAERLAFTAAGPAVRPGDLYCLRMVGRTSPAGPYRKGLLRSRGSMEMFDGVVDTCGGATWSLDAGSHCPEGGSTASLKVTMPAASTVDGKTIRPGVWHWWAVRNQRELRFNPGKTYRGQVWLRQEGLSGGNVTLQLSTIATRTFTVDETWRKFEFDLPVDKPARPYPDHQCEDSKLAFTTTGGGTLWIDNCLIWQDDTPPFAFLPEYRQTLADWKPSTLRLWAGIAAVNVDLALREGFARSGRGRHAGTSAPDPLPIPASLRLCREVGADPWLILNPFWSEEDHRLLMEYLAGPSASAGGRIRAAQGQERPWTEVFRCIRLECGNEAWNTMFQPLAWPGKPALYAAIADRQFSELMASPHFRRDRFAFVLNGWDGGMSASGWTGQVTAASRLGDQVDVAGYFGGWEKGTGGGAAASGLAEFQDKLFGSELEFSRKWLGAQTVDPSLGRRLAGAMQDDPAMAGRLFAAVGVKGKWEAAQLPALSTGDLRGAMAALIAADGALAGEIAKAAEALRDPLDLPVVQAQRWSLVRDPAALAQTCSDLGIEPAVAERLGGLMTQVNSLKGYADLGRKYPAAAEAMANAAVLELKPATAVQISALADGKQPDWAVPNAINAYARKRAQAALAADPAALAKAIRTQADAAFQRSFADDVRYQFDSRMRSLGARASDQLLALLRREPAAAARVFQGLAGDPLLFRPQAEAVATGLAATMPVLAKAQAGGNRLNLLPALPPADRDALIADLLAAAEDPVLGYPADALQLARAAAAACQGDASRTQALLHDERFVDALARRIATNLQDALLKAADDDASLGEALLTALAAQPSTGKRFCVYEGGPGYALPGPGKQPAEDDENMGKSLALGTAVLDSYMMATRAGAGPACYFNFKSGPHWAHQNNPIDRIPYPTWQAMGLRNRLCSGDLVRSERLAGETRDLPDRRVIKTTNDGKGKESVEKGRRAVPLTAAYAFRDGKRLSILLLNRDAGETRHVRIELPSAPAAPAQVILLTADSPMANNRATLQVRETQAPPVDLAAGALVPLPPAATAVVTVELR
ncbi:MAG: hypothetical protein J0M02_06245 [Planctomycetes bacterium]|nr:hypothetical protein [Planctomycetota bacterium]